MRFTYNVLRYVKTGLQRALRAVRAVNVFKKKRGGASLCKSEEIILRVSEIQRITSYRHLHSARLD